MDTTIILVGDRLQALMVSDNDGQNPDSEFHRTLTAIGDLTQQGPFLLPCCTATISGPVLSTLRASNRKRVYLPVTSLEPPTIQENGRLKLVGMRTERHSIEDPFGRLRWAWKGHRSFMDSCTR